MSARDFDVVLYGATGFTGRQAVAYFARRARPGTRWAIAGRNRQKLEALGAGVPILVAETANQAEVDAIVARTRALLTTAGPFRIHGDPLVDACVRLGTHYVDISGETARIRDLVDRHHRAAEAARARIVPFCGFSSAPADLAVYLLDESLGGRLVEAKGRVTLGGGSFNGGTIASIGLAHENGDFVRERDVFLLGPDARRPIRPVERDPRGVRYDREAGVWTAPAPMGVSDTRAVRRSGVLRRRDVVYREHLAFPGRAGLWKALGFEVAMLFLGLLMRHAPTRGLLQRLIPAGSGPSERAMDEAWFELRVSGKTDAGEEAVVTMRGQGDAGNRITVTCACESALAMAEDEAALPPSFGVLTPSTAMGNVLSRRLVEAGIEIEVRAARAHSAVTMT